MTLKRINCRRHFLTKQRESQCGWRHMCVEFVVGSLLCSERFFSGFPFSSKTNISKFQFDHESGRQRTTLWMYNLLLIIYLYLFIHFIFYFHQLLKGQKVPMQSSQWQSTETEREPPNLILQHYKILEFIFKTSLFFYKLFFLTPNFSFLVINS